jgi:ABC-type uncharacterized transport system permease subunit
MGAFTAPLVFLLQGFALIVPIDVRHPVKLPPNSWLEFHASVSMVAYGAFGLACIAGVMYLVQERQLKTHQLRSIFFHLPPLTDLFAAITRLLWWGFVALHPWTRERFFTEDPCPVQLVAAVGVWLLYAAILQGRHLPPAGAQTLSPRFAFSVFTAALTLLWESVSRPKVQSLP